MTSGQANPGGDDVGTLLLHVNGTFALRPSREPWLLPVDDRADAVAEPCRLDGFRTRMYDSSFAVVDIDGDDDRDLIVPSFTRFEIDAATTHLDGVPERMSYRNATTKPTRRCSTSNPGRRPATSTTAKHAS